MGFWAPGWAALENEKDTTLTAIRVWGQNIAVSVRSPTTSHTQTLQIKWKVHIFVKEVFTHRYSLRQYVYNNTFIEVCKSSLCSWLGLWDSTTSVQILDPQVAFQMGSHDATVCGDSQSDSICLSPGTNLRFCNWQKLPTLKKSPHPHALRLVWYKCCILIYRFKHIYTYICWIHTDAMNNDERRLL